MTTPEYNTDHQIYFSDEIVEAPLVEETVDIGLSGKVILFNDEWHTFEEVIEQIIKATGCSMGRAEYLTWQVHSQGKANVYEGDFGRCVRVSGVLEEISLRTHIEV
jgi:hypothetical protein